MKSPLSFALPGDRASLLAPALRAARRTAWLAALSLAQAACWATTTPPADAEAAGIRFTCGHHELDRISLEMAHYLAGLQIAPDLYAVQRSATALTYTLHTPPGDTDTLGFIYRPEYRLAAERVHLVGPRQRLRAVDTVSRKEIVLALMQHGRLTELSGASCRVAALAEHVELRQNIVAWTQSVTWVWPNGESASWNTRLWQDGTPRQLGATPQALQDAFVAPGHYRIGCYTASKLAVAQGTVDYYLRIQRDHPGGAEVLARLLSDRDPLVDIEPSAMWPEEASEAEADRPGKLVRLMHGVAPRNFVPGDWVYILNTDPQSHGKIGYEGSNAIYLGGNRFDDYYNDNQHSYRYDEKLAEVYQWRHGVFSRSRDFAKLRPISPADRMKLDHPPEQGGLVEGFRAVPYFFGYEALPALTP